MIFSHSKYGQDQGNIRRSVSFLRPVLVKSLQGYPPGLTAEMGVVIVGCNVGRGITTGVHTFITAIGMVGRDRTIWTSNCIQQQKGYHQNENNQSQSQFEIPFISKHHHHRMGFFSRISTVTGSNLFHNESDRSSYPHPPSHNFDGLQGQGHVLHYPHNQIQKSATTLHNSLKELETNSDTFLQKIR